MKLCFSSASSDCIGVMNVTKHTARARLLYFYNRGNRRYIFPANEELTENLINGRETLTEALLQRAKARQLPIYCSIDFIDEMHGTSVHRKRVYLRDMLNAGWSMRSWLVLLQYSKCTTSGGIFLGLLPPPSSWLWTQ